MSQSNLMFHDLLLDQSYRGKYNVTLYCMLRVITILIIYLIADV